MELTLARRSIRIGGWLLHSFGLASGLEWTRSNGCWIRLHLNLRVRQCRGPRVRQQHVADIARGRRQILTSGSCHASRARGWVFNSVGSQFPGGVFTTRELAEVWIRQNSLSGTLTAYPLDEGSFDWALRTGAVTGSARNRGDDPRFVGGFSSAVQDHFHYEKGIPH